MAPEQIEGRPVLASDGAPVSAAVGASAVSDVIQMAGAATFDRRSSASEREIFGWSYCEYLLRGGRAVMLPLWKGSYERSDGFHPLQTQWPSYREMILSPDGRRLIVVTRGADGVRRLFRRNLNESHGETLPNTEGAYAPFFSPDGEQVGFFARGKLKKTNTSGGAVTTLCDAPAGRGGTWAEDDTIVAALDTRVGLSSLSAGGGPVTPFTRLNPERREASHCWPRYVPGGKGVIFSAAMDPAYWRSADVAVALRPTGQSSFSLRAVDSAGDISGPDTSCISKPGLSNRGRTSDGCALHGERREVRP
jgi:hypothetical protein